MGEPVRIWPDVAYQGAVAILGTIGSGKTYLAKVAAESELAAGRRFCIIDPTGAWWGLRSSADGMAPGFPVIVFGGEHEDLPLDERSGEAVGKLIAARSLQVVLDVSEMSMSGRVRFVTALLEALYHHNRQPLNLVIDEADLFAPQRPMPDQTVMLNRMENIVRRGRIRGFRPWLITQRPAELHKSVLSQASTLVALKLTAPQDRNAIGDWIKGQADADEGKRVLADLPKLARGEGFVWCPGAGVLERRAFPKISTFDSSRTPEDGETIAPPARMAAVDLAEITALLAPPAEAVKPGKTAKVTEADNAAALQQAEDRGYVRGVVDGEARGIAIGIGQAKAAIEALGSAPIQAVLAPVPRQSQPKPPVASRPAVTKPNGLGAKGKVLDSLAWWKAAGFPIIDRRRACVLAGYSPKASTFGVYISEMVRDGLVVVPEPGKLSLTPEGAAKANPMPEGDLMEAARALLSPAEVKVFDPIVDAYPAFIARPDLADAVGLSRTASTLGVYLSKIGSFGLTESERGKVRAADWLFPRSETA